MTFGFGLSEERFGPLKRCDSGGGHCDIPTAKVSHLPIGAEGNLIRVAPGVNFARIVEGFSMRLVGLRWFRS